MGRRRWNRKHPQKAEEQRQPRTEDVVDPPARLLALQPDSTVVAVAIGPRVTLVDYKTGEVVPLAIPAAPAAAPTHKHNARAQKKQAAAAAAAAAASTDAAAATAEPATAELAAEAGSTAAAAAAAAEPTAHHGNVRVLAFSPDGRCLLTGGDDKAARLWAAPAASSGSSSTGSGSSTRAAWPCVASWRCPKKTSAGGFSHAGTHALFADKFGDVLVGPVPADLDAAVAAAAATATAGGATADGSAATAGAAAGAAAAAAAAPSTLLGHFCSIVTGVAAAPCGRLLATSDKDYKVRVSVLPPQLHQISVEVQAYCLGHQDFVSCIAFAVRQPGSGSGSGSDALLVSGSGDGTVRLWDYASGAQLASYVASQPISQPAAAAAAPGGAEGAEDREGGEEGGEGEEGAAGDGEGEGGEGEEAEGTPTDDMKLAWEMIELSRIIYDRNSPEQHHSKLAEVHKSLGDIKSEEERFEEAAECYRQSIAHLKAMQPPSKRRIAEVQYKLSLSLTFMEQPDQALAQTEEAIGSLEAAAGEIEEKLAALPTDGSGGEEAEEEGRRLQETADDLRAVMTELTHNCEGLRDTIKHNNSLKEALRQAFIKANGGAAALAGAAGGSSGSFAAPTNAAAAAATVSLGVVGRGTKRITLQPAAAPAQGQPADGAAAGGSAAPPPKRTLADLTVVQPPLPSNSPGLAASGQGASVVGATAAGTADGQAQAQEPAKRARLEEAAAAPSEAPSSDAAK